MAETIQYQVTAVPRVTEEASFRPSPDRFQINTILTTTNRDALLMFLQKIKDGTDVSTVITAINAL